MTDLLVETSLIGESRFQKYQRRRNFFGVKKGK